LNLIQFLSCISLIVVSLNGDKDLLIEDVINGFLEGLERMVIASYINVLYLLLYILEGRVIVVGTLLESLKDLLELVQDRFLFGKRLIHGLFVIFQSI
jgi:hypothetical protein